MNLGDFVAWAKAHSPLLWAPTASREFLRGQCVQLVCFYVDMVWHLPIIWADAYPWFAGGEHGDLYDRIANDHNNPNQVPQPGDLIVWGPSLPNSGGAGHIAICLSANPGAASFVTLDQNWGGKYVHEVTHNWSYVVGWMRPRGHQTGGDAPQPQGGDEVIQNTEMADKIYKMLRPNGSANPDEINSTAGKRTYTAFVNDAAPEVAARDAALRGQVQRLNDMQATINSQNAALTDLTGKLNDVTTSNTDKQAALQKALDQISSDNANMTQLHDQIVELQAKVNAPLTAAADAKALVDNGTLVQRVLAVLLRFKKK
jgi:hypothetical protein